jgi:hypothetical protein
MSYVWKSAPQMQLARKHMTSDTLVIIYWFYYQFDEFSDNDTNGIYMKHLAVFYNEPKPTYYYYA